MALPLPSVAPPAQPGRLQNELTSWTEAAVCDRLLGFYASAIPDAARARQAARLHWSCWRAYLGLLAMQGRAARQSLTRLIQDAQTDPELIDRADQVVVDELTDLVLQRYRRAPLQAKPYITAIVVAATRMAAGRAG